ncbi:MAG: hypothetical protein SPE94_05165 [Collinsella sp.]|nr:hypothetical protein [Collinsella sp.]
MSADGVEVLLAISRGSVSRQFKKPQAEGKPLQSKFTLQQIVDPQQSL